MSKGLAKMPATPRPSAALASIARNRSSPTPDTITTGRSSHCGSARSRERNSKPSIPGIRMSRRTSAGAHSARLARALAPSANPTARYPVARSASTRTVRTGASSSTTNMLFSSMPGSRAFPSLLRLSDAQQLLVGDRMVEHLPKTVLEERAGAGRPRRVPQLRLARAVRDELAQLRRHHHELEDPGPPGHRRAVAEVAARSEEHTSELQSPTNLVCRLLLEKKKN